MKLTSDVDAVQMPLKPLGVDAIVTDIPIWTHNFNGKWQIKKAIAERFRC